MSLKDDYRELSQAAYGAGRVAGHLEALKILVDVLERAPVEAKDSIMNACERVSRLKDQAETA